MPIYRQSISIFHQKSMKKGPNLLKKSIFLPKMSLSISIFPKMNLSISISIFSKMDLSISIFSRMSLSILILILIFSKMSLLISISISIFSKISLSMSISISIPIFFRNALSISIFFKSVNISTINIDISNRAMRERERLAHKALGLLLSAQSACKREIGSQGSWPLAV